MAKAWSIKACGCAGVDVHCHVVPASFPAAPAGMQAGWPSLRQDGCGHGTVIIDAKPYRTVSAACWEARRRLEDMDRMGIAVQALSPMPELFSYWLPAQAAAGLIRHVNDMIAALLAEGQGRFVGLAAVPLQDLDLAVEELRRVMAIPGFRGVEIGSNINETPIGDPRLRPFFTEAARLGAAVFVHAVRPAGMARLVGPAPLQQVLGYPTDVGLALASAITGGLVRDCPDLRLGFSHGGGSFAALLPRLRRGYEVFPALREALEECPSITARRLYVDSLVFEPDWLSRLVTLFGAERVMLGTDYPFNFSEAAPCDQVNAACPDADVRQRLIQRNALAFLAIDEVQDAA